MIAALGMYDMPALQPVNDRFWSLVRSHLGYGPESLTRDADPWQIWQHPALVLAQTCGMPYRTRLHSTVRLVGTPDYGLAGCPPGYYRSIFVVRQDDTRDLNQLIAGRFAYNEVLSQSGWAAPIVHLEQAGQRPAAFLATGSHAQSACAVSSGRADVAALDALTWELLKEHSTLGTDLREVCATPPTPALPFITAKDQDAPLIAQALRAAIGDLSQADRAALHLRGLIDIPASAYLAVPNPSQDYTTGPNR